MSDHPDFTTARSIARELIARFESGEIKEVYMVYTKFISAISCEAQTVQLLPFQNVDTEDAGIHAEYIYEPDAATVLGFLLPQYLYTTVYAAMLQSAASEVSSRMNAMSNATDNADELMHKLDLYYNKVRQAGITTELTEIVGGAAALE
jgi:F-type H+-transporting ATPase subunit gamma